MSTNFFWKTPKGCRTRWLHIGGDYRSAERTEFHIRFGKHVPKYIACSVNGELGRFIQLRFAEEACIAACKGRGL